MSLRKGWYFSGSLLRWPAGPTPDKSLPALRRVVERAHRDNAWYRRHFATAGFHPSMLESLADFERVPLLHRHDFDASPEALYLRRPRPPHEVVLTTSGTLGEPLRVIHSREAVDRSTACFARWLWKLGFHPPLRLAMYRTPGELATATRFWYHRLGLMKKLWIDAAAEPAVQLSELRRFKPDLLFAYPYALLWIVTHLLAPDEPLGFAPQAVVSFGEYLSPQIRTILEGRLQVPIYNWYASTEFWGLAGQCRGCGHLHLEPETTYLEVLHEGRPVIGKRGTVVCTSLHNDLMPLIRYVVGDEARLEHTVCACGYRGPSLVEVGGYRSKKKTALAHWEKILSSIEETLIGQGNLAAVQLEVQIETGELVVRYVRGARFEPQDPHRLEQLVYNLGIPVKLFLLEVGRIAPLASGKQAHLLIRDEEPHNSSRGKLGKLSR